MRNIGSLFFFFGVGSVVLYFLNMEFIVLSWISMWGETVAWVIRGALIIVGGALWLMGSNESEEME